MMVGDVTDTMPLLELLRNRFGGKTHVAGFSFGATLGAYAAAQRPDLVATLVAVGMDIDGAAASIRAVEETLARSVPGAFSAAAAFGAGFALTIPDTARIDTIPAEAPDASAQHRLAEMTGRLVPPGDVNG